MTSNTLRHGKRYALYALLMLGSQACVAAAGMHSRAPGHLDLSQALPAPSASPFGSAYGARQASGLYAAETPNLDAYLKPQPQPAHQPREQAAPQLAKRTTAVRVVTPTPVLLAAATPLPPTAAASPLAATKPADDANHYAQRQDKALEQYRGGDVIVIGASTLLIVLLVVLLVVLLLR